MEEESLSFDFELVYGNEPVRCEVIMKSNSYDILFDGRWMASVEYTGDWEWIQLSGVILPEEIIDEIGFKIEREYK